MTRSASLKIIVVILIAAFSFLSYNIYLKAAHVSENKKRLSELPAFKVHRLNGTTVDIDDLRVDAGLILIFFHPECDICSYEAEKAVNYSTELKGANIVWMTSADRAVASEFANEYNLSELPGHTVGTEMEGRAEKLFDVRQYPSIFIYDGDGLLLQRFTGETKWEAIVKSVRP